jgi:hypothetical protein
LSSTSLIFSAELTLGRSERSRRNASCTQAGGFFICTSGRKDQGRWGQRPFPRDRLAVFRPLITRNAQPIHARTASFTGRDVVLNVPDLFGRVDARALGAVVAQRQSQPARWILHLQVSKKRSGMLGTASLRPPSECRSTTAISPPHAAKDRLRIRTRSLIRKWPALGPL